MGLYPPRQKLGFPELVERFRARHPGMTFDQAVRELSRRSAEARRRRAAAAPRVQKSKWWDN